MRNVSVIRRFAGIRRVLVLSGALMLAATSALAQTFTTVYQFTGGSDGSNPVAGLALDSLGNIYGTTKSGGANFLGTVFELPSKGKGVTVLYSFAGGSDGAFPWAGVAIDNAGNLYGTTFNGGGSTNCGGGCGTVFKLTKGTRGSFTESVLHQFTGGPDDGANPTAGVIIDNLGDLDGTTSGGGSSFCNCLGTVFQLTNTNGAYTESVLYSFTGVSDGSNIQAGVTGDAFDGNLYGVAHNTGAANGGTVFELMPPVMAAGSWTETTLYPFNSVSGTDGFGPSATLLDPGAGLPGSLYGTTNSGGTGTCDCGTVFKVTKNSDGTWTETLLYSFKGDNDGASPFASVIADASGNLFGTTQNGGGSTNCSGGCGTVFELAKNSDGTYTESVLHAFTGQDGEFPAAGLLADFSGNLYGTTQDGGASDSGTVFKIALNKKGGGKKGGH